MTEQEFLNINPAQKYGNGVAGLLYSSSVVDPGSDDTPIAPFVIQGLTLPNTSKSGVDVTAALKQVNSFIFDSSGSRVETKVLARQVRSGYTFFRLQPRKLAELPTGSLFTDVNANPSFPNSEFVFNPYLGSDFKNSDYNPLMNNSETSRLNSFKSVVDRDDSQFQPSNLAAIVAGTAGRAELQHSNYTDSGLKNARYDGTEENSGSVFYDDPAITVRNTKGSIHPLGALNTRIAAGTVTTTGSIDRDPLPIYFRVDRTPTDLIPQGIEYISGSNLVPILKGTYGTAASIVGSILYEEIEDRLVRIPNKKVFIEETGAIMTTNGDGIVTDSEVVQI